MNWHEALAGKFIVLDGGDGCGKSTIADRLEGELEQASVPVLRVREPGCTEYGEKIRDLLLYWEPKSGEQLHPITEVFLFTAARTQLLHTKIVPAMDDGYCVIADRFVTSTFAYQGAAGGIKPSLIMDVARASILPGQWPWLTIILDVPHEVAVERMRSNGEDPDRIERQGDEYHRAVREGFRDMPNLLGHAAVRVLNATSDIDVVFADVCELLKEQLL